MDNKNLFSIGEIAKAVGITRKAILGYEAKGLLKPDKKDGDTGNRYYTVDTCTKVRTIRILQNLGLTLDEIRDYYNGVTDLQPMIQRLEKMRDELNLTIEKLKERTCEQGNAVKEISIEPYTVYCRTYYSTSVADRTNLLRDTLLEAMRECETDTTKRLLSTEYSLDSPDDITFCVAVPGDTKGEHIKQISESKGLSFFYHGAYENLPRERKRIILYAEENNIKLSGIFRHVFLEGPPQHKDKSKFITQIIAIIE